MDKLPVVVFVSEGGFEDGDWIIDRLRPDFAVRIITDSEQLDDALRSVRCCVIVGNAPAQSKGRARKPVIRVPSTAALLKGNDIAEYFDVIPDEQVSSRLTPAVAAAAITELLDRSRKAVIRSNLFERRDLVREVTIRMFTEPPLVSVQAAARTVRRSRDWLEQRWAEITALASPAPPPVADQIRGILFLRCLAHRLRDRSAPLEDVAAARRLSVATLRRHFVHYTGKLPSALTVEDAVRAIIEMERQLLGWLLPPAKT